MRVGASLFLIAVGAILKFAVNKHVNGIDLNTVGVILMVIGAAGLLISLVFVGMRRRTDVIYRTDGATYMQPSTMDPRL